MIDVCSSSVGKSWRRGRRGNLRCQPSHENLGEGLFKNIQFGQREENMPVEPCCFSRIITPCNVIWEYDVQEMIPPLGIVSGESSEI